MWVIDITWNNVQVGLKKSKLVEQILTQLEVGVSPMPTEEITGQFNELRNDILFLLELKIAQETLQFDIQALKHRVCYLYHFTVS